MPKKRLIRLLTALIIAAIAMIVSAIQPKPQAPSQSKNETVLPGYYQVTEAVDGDTIEVVMGDKNERVRLIGIDTPETKKPNSAVQCFGREASNFAKQTLQGKAVRLEADPSSDNRDRYDRLLRYVYLSDGTLFNQLAIEQGFAFAYLVFPFGKHEAFAASQKTAQSSGRGVWTSCTPILKNNRWQSNDLP